MYLNSLIEDFDPDFFQETIHILDVSPWYPNEIIIVLFGINTHIRCVLINIMVSGAFTMS